MIILPAGAPAPAGCNFLGTSALIYVDAASHTKTLSVKYYQRP